MGTSEPPFPFLDRPSRLSDHESSRVELVLFAGQVWSALLIETRLSRRLYIGIVAITVIRITVVRIIVPIGISIPKNPPCPKCPAKTTSRKRRNAPHHPA